MSNTRVQNKAVRRRKEEVKNFAIIAGLLLFLVGFLLAIAYAGMGQMDRAVCRQASDRAYQALDCQNVSGVTR